MATTITSGPAPTSAPLSLANTANDPITPLSISATFVGTGAGADFMPCVSFYTPDGRLIGRFQGEATVTAGDTAQETFAPFLRRASSGSGIQFDVDNVGDWLNIVTTGAETGSTGINIATLNGNDIEIDADSADNGFFEVGAGTIHLDATHSGISLTASNGASIVLFTDPGSGVVDIETGLTVKLQTATDVVIVNDHLGSPLFKIDESGNLHGKTGKSLVFDL